MTAAAKNGKKFKGTYTINRFTQSGGKVYAVGALKGKLKGRNVKRSGVRIPRHARPPPDAAARLAAAAEPDRRAPARCSTSCCSPIDLNLLGLRLATSRIEVLLEAVPGANALLGNLLCAITGISRPAGR